MQTPNLQKHIEDTATEYQSARLTSAERVALKNRVRDACQQEARSVSALGTQRWRYHWMQIVHPVRIAVATLVVLVVVTTPVTFAAERSLPGDRLYVVKTVINEPLVGAFVAEAEKDEYQQSLVVRRASELAVLKKRNALTEERISVATETLAENVRDALASVAVSEDPEDDVLQDQQTIIALVSAAERLLAPDAGSGAASVTESALLAIDTVGSMKEAATAGAATTSPGAMLALLKAEAQASLDAQVRELVQASDTERNDIIQDLVEDAAAAGEVVVAEMTTEVADGPAAIVAQPETAAVMADLLTTQADSAATMRVAPAETMGVAAARVLQAVPETAQEAVERVLDVHERLAEVRAAQHIDAMVAELEE